MGALTGWRQRRPNERRVWLPRREAAVEMGSGVGHRRHGCDVGSTPIRHERSARYSGIPASFRSPDENQRDRSVSPAPTGPARRPRAGRSAPTPCCHLDGYGPAQESRTDRRTNAANRPRRRRAYPAKSGAGVRKCLSLLGLCVGAMSPTCVLGRCGGRAGRGGSCSRGGVLRGRVGARGAGGGASRGWRARETEG